MNMKTRIGIVGQGFVGTAIKEGLNHLFNMQTYDKFKKEASTCASLQELSKKVEMLFICLPTPMNKDGSCNLSIIESVIEELDGHDNNNIAIIKSTIPPGTTERLNSQCQNLKVVFSPEFLTEANFIDDLGADSLDTVELVMAFEEEFGSEISDSEAEKILTVGDAVKFIESKST